jgi:hypothetical protein
MADVCFLNPSFGTTKIRVKNPMETANQNIGLKAGRHEEAG